MSFLLYEGRYCLIECWPFAQVSRSFYDLRTRTRLLAYIKYPGNIQLKRLKSPRIDSPPLQVQGYCYYLLYSSEMSLRASAGETGAHLEMKVGRFRLKLVHKVVMWTYIICQSFRFNDLLLAEFWISAPQGSPESDF